MPVDLNFSGAYTPPAGNDVDLNFGSSTPTAITAVIVGLFSPLSANIAATWDVNTFRGLERNTEIVWEEGTQKPQEPGIPWQTTALLTKDVIIKWESPVQLIAQTQIVWEGAKLLAKDFVLPWEQATVINSQVAISWQQSLIVARTTEIKWQQANVADKDVSIVWDAATTIQIDKNIKWQEGRYFELNVLLPWKTPKYVEDSVKLPWQLGVQPPPGAHPVIPPGPVTPPFAGNPNLDFVCLFTGTEYQLLQFGITCQGFVPPPEEPFMGVNTATLIRVSDSLDVPIFQASVSLDIDSWSWGFTATLANEAALVLVKPPIGGTPIEVRLTINGYSWLLQVSSYTRSRVFGQNTWTIKGESVHATLSTPYTTPDSRIETTLRLANQIADDELATTGYTLNWNLVDWLIEPNVYNYTNLTPIDAMLLVIRAVGGVLQADPNTKSFTALPRYTFRPWDWATTVEDFSLNEAVVRNLGVDWDPRPKFNAVFVTGRDQGVSVNAKITGTAGNVLAPMVVDPLITRAVAGTERARQILSNTRDFEIYTLEMPLNSFLGAPPLILNGKLVKITESSQTWIGMVVSNEIRLDRGAQGPLKVAQILRVERFLGPNP